MRTHHTRTALVAVAAALTTIATATPSHAATTCASNAICLWTEKNGGGQLFTWKAGYVDLPSQFRDHTFSFRANRNGAFIDWKGGVKNCRNVRKGDFSNDYSTGFGKMIDAVGDNC
ncbi:peptidase inhibitor family I36 protein [Streptomyces sp. NPDC056987]|uniref:peptidase inhibitor family I36 protein n=1 Tax=Streptomyces sp. NPDC056987 TaxID=3345988 RepID=UPI00362A93A2